MDKCVETANIFVAMLRVAYDIHQTNHWLFKGPAGYGHHKLYQRIYESALEDLDSCAEKFIGALGDESVSYIVQKELTHKIGLKYKDKSGLEQSLAVEKDMVNFIETAYQCFEDNGKLTQGIANMIGNVSDARETAIYLLQRALG